MSFTDIVKKPWFLNSIKSIIAIIVSIGIVISIQRAMRDLYREETKIGETIEELKSKAMSSTNLADQQQLQDRIESLEQQRREFWHMSIWSILASAILYMLGSLPAAYFWHRTLAAFGHSLRLRHSFAIYFLGHLGKYVPGKAMVIVLRAGRLRTFAVPTSVAIISIFVETLSLMAVGSTLGALTILLVKPPLWLVVGAWGLVLVAAIPTLPPIFRRVILFLANRRAGLIPKDLEHGLSWSLCAQGWLWLSIGWILMGGSLQVLLMGMGATEDMVSVQQLGTLPICIAAAALSVVAGIVSLLPGGAGIRELVLTLLLFPVVGSAPALAAAILMRLISIGSELILVAITQTIAVRGSNSTFNRSTNGD